MGSVWLAERIDQRFDQRVAIKLLTRADHTRELFERFQAERRVLARLEHPNIARLIDGAETDDGIAFLIMEYVADAKSITAFVQDQNLSVVERIVLFRSVCAAIQFAHQHLIVHRDLKPANVLVTPSGQPKLVDFGIARLMTPNADANVKGDASTHGLRLTVAYASPEQRQGRPISTAADIYSLGILLHEVLTGQLPSSVKSETCGEQKKLEGELKSIVQRATAPEPQDRYPTAIALSEDLLRYVVRQPIFAHSSAISYRARKFLTRHKIGVIIASGYMITLLAVTATALEQAYRARRRFREVERLSHSVLFEIHDAIRDLPGATAARQLIVSRALEHLDWLVRDSRRESSLQLELANAYLRVGDVQGKPYTANLGDPLGALNSYIQAAELAKSVADSDRSSAISARTALSQAYESEGAVLSRLNRSDQASHSHRKALAIRQQLLHDDPSHAEQFERGIIADDLGLGDAVVSANRLNPTPGFQQSALSYYRPALALCEKLVASHPESSTDRFLLAALCSRIAIELSELAASDPDAASFPEASALHRRTIDIIEAELRREPGKAASERNLADELISLAYSQALFRQNLDQALQECARARALLTQLAHNDPSNVEAQQDLSSSYFVEGRVLQARGEFAAAATAYRQCLSILEPLVSAHHDNVETEFDLARVREALLAVSRVQAN